MEFWEPLFLQQTQHQQQFLNLLMSEADISLAQIEDAFSIEQVTDEFFNKYKDLFLDKKQELFYCLYLNNKNYVIERKLLFMGTINKSVVHPREIFKEAYLIKLRKIFMISSESMGRIFYGHAAGRINKKTPSLSIFNGLR